MTKTTIAYLIPEFPGQTHNFFWRERSALNDLGHDVRLVSTRRPPVGVSSPSWAAEASAQTSYLFPLAARDMVDIGGVLLNAGVGALWHCLCLIIGAKELSLAERLRLAALLPFAAKLAATSKAQAWSHIHVHSCADAANIAMFASILSTLRYSLTLHNPLAAHGSNQPRKWSHARFAIVITRQIYAEVTQTLRDHLPPHLGIAPMGVDTDVFRRTKPYEPYFGTGRLNVFSCGRLNPAKGFSYLIDAIGLLRQRDVDVVLNIAGEDDKGGSGYRATLQQQIEQSGLSERIHLMGAVTEEQVKSKLEGAHIFTLASPEEPLGVVFMEAMAMNVPVIAANGGGVPELINDSSCGILVPSRDAVALADAIQRVALDRTLALSISAAGRSRIVNDFNHTVSARMIARLLREA